VRPEGLGKLKNNSFTSSGLEPETFQLAASISLIKYPEVSFWVFD
jgi:hypothetical protein